MFDFPIELIEHISLNNVTCVERERENVIFLHDGIHMANCWLKDLGTTPSSPPKILLVQSKERTTRSSLIPLLNFIVIVYLPIFKICWGVEQCSLNLSLSLCPLLCSLCVGLYLPLSVVYFMNLPVNFAFSLTFAFRVFLSYQSFRWPHNTVFWGLFIYLLVLISGVYSKSQQKLQIKKCFS